MGRDFGAREAEEIGFVSEVVNGGRAQVVGKSSQVVPMNRHFSMSWVPSRCY